MCQWLGDAPAMGRWSTTTTIPTHWSHTRFPRKRFGKIQKKTFYCHKSGVDQLMFIYHCQVRQECPWIDLIFCTFFAHPPIFLPFLWPAACIVPSSKPISNNAPKMVATGPHTAIIWLKATLFIIGCTVGLTMCQTWCNKAEMMMPIQENCIPDPPIQKWPTIFA